MNRFRARWRCHRSLLCCQYVDGPLCNGTLETHRLARWGRRVHRMVRGV